LNLGLAGGISERVTVQTDVAKIDWSAWQPTERANLCFVVRDGKILLIRKKRGLGAGKINGPGGRIENGETALQSAVRETQEEIGVTPVRPSHAGELFFQFADGFKIHVEVFCARSCRGKPRETDEAIPMWVALDSIPYREMWADDEHWLPWLIEGRKFRGYFAFEGDRMLSHRLEEWSKSTSGAAPMMREMADSQKPRERLERDGADALHERELIAILLRTGRRGMSVLGVADQLLSKFNTLDALAKADWKDLRVPGIGKAKAIELKAAFTLARRLSKLERAARPEISTPQQVADHMRDEVMLLSHEEFFVLLLDTKNRLLRAESVTRGTHNATLVDPRSVFVPALREPAASVILVHNHPSGDPTPSREDISLTKELVKAGQILKIDVLDHVIMGRKTKDRVNEYVSLKELGLL
jgi:DNA repair protein RadC